MEIESADEESGDSIPRPLFEALSELDSRSGTPMPVTPTPSTSHAVLSKRNKKCTEMNTMEIVANNTVSPSATVPPLTMKFIKSTPINGTASKVATSTQTKHVGGTGVKDGHFRMVFRSDEHGTLEARTVQSTDKDNSIENKFELPISPTPIEYETDFSEALVELPKHDSTMPLSREYTALQKSLNDSKILAGFVSGTADKLSRRKSRSLRYGVAENLRTESRCKSFSYIENHSSQHKSKSKKNRQHSIHGSSKTEDITISLHKSDTESSRSKSVKSPDIPFRLSEERPAKRTNMRSDNKEFKQKQQSFLDRYKQNASIDYPTELIAPAATIEITDESELVNASLVSEHSDSQDISGTLQSNYSVKSSSSLNLADEDAERIERKLAELWQPPPKEEKDPFCWKCYSSGGLVSCSKCLRSFHPVCLKTASTRIDATTWICVECTLVESTPKRSRRSIVSPELLSQLLTHALKRMRHVKGITQIVSPQELLPHSYSKYFVNPVTFATLEKKINAQSFRSADEFVCETKWMLHNAQILSKININSNGSSSGSNKHAHTEKLLLKVCRQEANEIDTCAQCYLNANTNEVDWFVQVCDQPHLLLWAKLKGFPYWPAKAMGSGPGALVNVRFFGKHDRANVPVKDCFLYSMQDPNSQTGRRSARDLADCIHEVEVHIDQIRTKIGDFRYAAYRTSYDPNEEQQQLQEMMPGVEDFIKAQQYPMDKPALQFLIRKTEGNNHSILKKSKTTTESGNDSDQSSNSPGKRNIQIEQSSEIQPPQQQPQQQSSHQASSSHEHSKLKNNNYEVITKLPHDETRVCSVILKRKTLADLENEQRKSQNITVGCEPSDPTVVLAKKRKHEHSHKAHNVVIENDAQDLNSLGNKLKNADLNLNKTSQTSQTVLGDGEGFDVNVVNKKRKNYQMSSNASGHNKDEQHKHRSKQQRRDSKRDEHKESKKSAEQISVEQLVQNKEGVTITKVPKDKSEKRQTETATTAADKIQLPEPEAKRKEENLIVSKVFLPLVEIKTEPEEELVGIRTPILPPPTVSPLYTTNTNLGHISIRRIENLRSNETTTTETDLSETKVANQVEIPITEMKEEILTDEECTDKQDMTEKSITAAKSVVSLPSQQPPAANTVIPMEALVRVVGDTTIQRLSNRQHQQHNSPPTTSKRHNVMRGVPYGPLPANATAASPEPPVTNSVNLNGATGNNKEKEITPPPQKQPLSTNAAIIQPAPTPHVAPLPQNTQPILRLKSNASLLETPLMSSNSSSLLKSNNMVIIPVDAATQQQSLISQHQIQQTRNSNDSSSTISVSAPSNILIPVPPLTAVSKNMAQSINLLPTSLPPSGVSISSVQPPPLAGLSMSMPMPTVNTPTIASITINGTHTDATQNKTVQETETVTVSPPVLPTTINEILNRGPPKLQQRPQGLLQSDGYGTCSSQAGPVSQKLHQNGHKIKDFFISVMVDTMSEFAATDPAMTEARIASLSLELENTKQTYETQLNDLRRSNVQMIADMRKSLEDEYKRKMDEVRRECEQERTRSVDEAKRKQWCAKCFREAYMYCCWNTSYCDTKCQFQHWVQHSKSCANESLNNQVQQQQQQQQDKMRNKSNKTQCNPANAMPQSAAMSANAICAQYNNKSATTATNNASYVPPKKWQQPSAASTSQQQTIISQMHTVPPSSEVLKLPLNTYLRPVSMASTMATATATTATVTTMSSNSSTVSLATLAPVTANARTSIPSNNAANNHAANLQRYNIPLSIAMNPGQTFTLMPYAAATSNVVPLQPAQHAQHLQPSLAPMSTSVQVSNAAAATTMTTQSHHPQHPRNYTGKPVGRPRGSFKKHAV